MKYGIIISICFISIVSSFTRADDISFLLVQNQIVRVVDQGRKISAPKLEKFQTKIKDKTCKRTQIDDEKYSISPLCLLQQKLPEIPVEDLANTIRPDVIGFDSVYNNTDNETFDYLGAQTIFGGDYKNIMSDGYKLAREAIATYHALKGSNIRISKQDLAKLQAIKYDFYVSKMDISPRQGCTLHNYQTALQSMDNVLIYPGQEFNFNTHITDLDYCKGTGPQNLDFYGGVCGAASQVFRVSLIHPDIDIVERYNHSERRGTYYGEKITGDDAAIYQNNKKLIIKNNGDRGIYFKTRENGQDSYLVALSPLTDKSVRITRQTLETRQTNLTKEIINNNTTQSAANFTSAYTKLNFKKN